MRLFGGPGRALIACLREAGSERVSPELDEALRSVDLSELVAEAVEQRVSGALLSVLSKSTRSSDPLVVELRDEVTHDAIFQMFLSSQLRAVAAALDDAGVRYAVVKGPVLAEHVYPDPSWRSYSDLDVLVASTDAPRARHALANLGGEMAGVQRRITERGFDGEVAIVLPSGLHVDLHHELVNDASVRRHFRVPIGEILHRTRLLPLRDLTVTALDPTDQLLHLCLHSAVSNGRKLVWLLDIDQAVRRDPPDLALLVRRAHRWRVGLPAAIMLERSRHILRTPVDDELLDELAPRGLWRRFCHGVLELRPPETGSDSVLGGGVVVASTREATGASIAALAQATWRDGVLAPIRNPQHPWRRRMRRKTQTVRTDAT